MTITLSNPRLAAEFYDWPLGGSKRGMCQFLVHKDPKKGYRVSRQTTGKPKYSTYRGKTVLCDGSDGRTYIVSYPPAVYGPSISVYDSAFMCTVDSVIPHYNTPRDGEVYVALAALIDQVHGA